MILKIKFKLKLYRRFEKDIWGLALIQLLPNNKFLEFLKKLYLFQQERRLRLRQDFTYDSVFVFKRKDKKKMKKRFVSLRLVKLYYVILKYKHFRNLSKIAGRRDGFFQSNFCYRLEGRLCSLIYRTNWLTTMFSTIYFIRSGNVLVNKLFESSPNCLVKVGDLVTFLEDNYVFFRFNLILRLKNRGVYFSVPRYMFVSYKFYLLSLLAYPQDADLAFPMKFDIYRISGYY